MGLLDFLGAILLLLLELNIFNSSRFLLIISVYLLGKGIIFKGDFASIVDFFCGLYFLLAFFGVRTFISYIIIFFLLQKSFFSLKN